MQFILKYDDAGREFERLRERHEALAGTVEMVEHRLQENSRQLQENTRQLQQNSLHIDRVVTILESLADRVAKMAGIVDRRELRLDRLEGGQA